MAKEKKAAVKKDAKPAQDTGKITRGLKVSEAKELVAKAREERTTIDTVYVVNASNNPVTLEVIPGDTGQSSVMTILLDDATIVDNLSGNFDEQAIGTNASLHGKELSIIANIADLSRTTNLTSLDITLKGGKKKQTIPLMKIVETEGDRVRYVCLIEFFNPRL